MGLPRAVLLDLDDTILDDSGGTLDCWRDACGICTSEEGVDVEALYRSIQKTREWYWSDAERHRVGRLDLEAAAREVVARALADLGLSNAALAASIARRYRQRRDEGLQLFPDAVETVRWLRTSGCRLALLTNGAAVAQRGKIDRFGLAGLFDAILIEGELGFGKPDPRIYTQALEELDVAAAETWMVGDNLEWDVAQPQRMGISGIWIDIRGTGLADTQTVRPARILRRLSELRSF